MLTGKFSNNDPTPQEIYDAAYSRVLQNNHTQLSFIQAIDDYVQATDHTQVEKSSEEKQKVVQAIRDNGYKGFEEGYTSSPTIDGKNTNDMKQELASGNPSFDIEDIAGAYMANVISGFESQDPYFGGMVHPGMSSYMREMCESRDALESNKPQPPVSE